MPGRYKSGSTFNQTPIQRPKTLEEATGVIAEMARDVNDLKFKLNQEMRRLERAIGEGATSLGAGGGGAGAGAAAGASSVERVDGSLVVSGVSRILLNQNSGFIVSSPSAGVARIDGYVGTQVGQVLYCKDGGDFSVETPLVSIGGWLANGLGELLIV